MFLCAGFGAHFVLAGVASSSGSVWYVNKDNGASGDGKTWATAFVTIQEGIDAAASARGGEVWVAAGTYEETRTQDSSGALLMKPGVAL